VALFLSPACSRLADRGKAPVTLNSPAPSGFFGPLARSSQGRLPSRFLPKSHPGRNDAVKLGSGLMRGSVPRVDKCLFGYGGGNVGAGRVDVHIPGFRDYDQIHILHRNCAKENLIPDYESAGESNAVLETQLDRSDVWHKLSAAVREDYFFPVNFFQLKLNLNMWRNAKVDGAGIDECINLNRLQVRLSGILQG